MLLQKTHLRLLALIVALILVASLSSLTIKDDPTSTVNLNNKEALKELLSPFYGDWLENPLYCDNSINIDDIRTHQLDFDSYVRLRSEFIPHWDVVGSEFISEAKTFIAECEALSVKDRKSNIAIRVVGVNWYADLLFVDGAEVVVARQSDGLMTIMHKPEVVVDGDFNIVTGHTVEPYDIYDPLSSYPVDSFYAEGSGRTIEDLYSDVEYLDDEEFYEQFKEADKLIKLFDQINLSSGVLTTPSPSKSKSSNN